MKWENAIKLLLTAGLSATGMNGYGDLPVGIVGGDTNIPEGFAEFVFLNGNVSPISGLSETTSINGVSINELGYALIGGLMGGNGYAAFVSPSGALDVLSSVPGDFPSATVVSTTINQSGLGLIGGNFFQFEAYHGGYAATASLDGAYNLLTFDRTISAIFSVALNGSGIGLIGGEGGGSPVGYAGYVVDNVVTPIPIDNSDNYSIVSVALNDQGNGIVGGYSVTGGVFTYAAFVTYNGGSPTASLITSGLPGNSIKGVAINDSGLALIGGEDGSGNLFAGYTNAQDLTVSNIITPLSEGTISSVAINSSGTGLIGGNTSLNVPYVAFLQSNGDVRSISLGLVGADILSVAINEAGVGLVGGVLSEETNTYAALIAPNGSVTPLNISPLGSAFTVALNNVTDAAVPTSTGPYLSAIYTQLAASSALQQRFIEQNRIWNQRRGGKVAPPSVAQNQKLEAYNETDLSQSGRPISQKRDADKPAKQNSIWVAPFGDYVHLKAEGAIPNYTNEIGGALLGYDHRGSNYMVGGTLGYAFNYIHYSNSLGHGKLQEEMASFYAAYQQEHFRFNGALWGGLYQFWNTRHTLSVITSKGSTNGWILSPHIEMASPWAMDQNGLYSVEPFFMLDWISSWQSHFTETGSAGFNLKVPSLYSSLLQSEAGLRFYEQFVYGWGSFCLEEKVSYINQAPFLTDSVSTSFVAAVSSFPIAVASTKVENLGSLQIMASFIPKNNSYPFGGFTLQATGNSSYQSYFASVFTGVDF